MVKNSDSNRNCASRQLAMNLILQDRKGINRGILTIFSTRRGSIRQGMLGTQAKHFTHKRNRMDQPWC